MDVKKLADKFGASKLLKSFGESKIVDGDGFPIVAYHGTDKDITSFAPGLSYFTPSTDYGFIQRSDAVYPAFLNIKNPYFTDVQREAETAKHWPEWIEELKAMGHDGIVYSKRGDITKGATGWGNDYPQYIAFEPTQIKSVFNEGSFDPTNPNILKAALPFAAGAGLMSMLPSDAEAVQRIREKDLPLEDAWNPLEAFAGGVPGGLKAAAMGVLPDGAMDWAFNRIGGLMSGGGK